MFFKKQISILIALLVLVSNSGLAFNVHYCEGEIASVTSVFSDEEVCEIPAPKEKTCCAEKEKTHEKCCSDKEVNLKNKTEKIIVKTISLDWDANAILCADEYQSSYIGVYQAPIYLPVVAYCCDANAPPFYTLYCQYTFYA